MAKEHTYGFLTQSGYLLDIKAANPRAAYLKLSKKAISRGGTIHTITKNYLTYDRFGFSQYNYKQVK